MGTEIQEVATAYPVAAQAQAGDSSSLMRIIEVSMTRQDFDIEKIQRLLDVKDRWEAKEAKRAFDAAFSAFKAEAVTILKGRKVTDGPLKGKSYAELHDVVNAVTPALSKHGLSSSWKLTMDEKDWMQVTCYLRHVNGHEESVSMGGPPDAGGAKNAIQARASTKTYLERYTLKAITGLSEQMDDDDGNGKEQKPGGDETFMKYESQLVDAKTVDEVRRIRALAGAAFEAVGDVASWNQFKTLADKKKVELERGAQ
jgi:hypothetical protein